MLKYDRENNKLVETDRRIKCTDEQLEVLTKIFKEWGIINGQHEKEFTKIRDRKEERYSK